MKLLLDRSTVDAIFILKQMIEKRRNFNLEIHIGLSFIFKLFVISQIKICSGKYLSEDSSSLGMITLKYPYFVKVIKSLYQNASVFIDWQHLLRQTKELDNAVSVSYTHLDVYKRQC